MPRITSCRSLLLSLALVFAALNIASASDPAPGTLDTEANKTAATKMTGTSTGYFVDPKGEEEITVTGIDSDIFSWGKKTTTGETNTMQFKGNAFTARTDEVFTIGKLYYYNGDTKKGTNATSIVLNIKLTFDNGTESSFFVPLQLVSTDNKSSHYENADIIKLFRREAHNLVIIGGKSYIVELEFGEASSDGYNSPHQFHVFEGYTASSELQARIREHNYQSFSNTVPSSAKTIKLPPPSLSKSTSTPPASLNRAPAPSFNNNRGKPIATMVPSPKASASGQAAYLSDSEFEVALAVVISFPTEQGRVYQPQISYNRMNWENWGDAALGTGSPVSITRKIDSPMIPNYRVQVTRSR